MALVAVGCDDGQLHLIDDRGELRCKVRAHNHVINAVALLACGKIVATASAGSDGVAALHFFEGKGAERNTFLASGSWDQSVAIWNTHTGVRELALVGHSDWDGVPLDCLRRRRPFEPRGI
ncbi:hypothetical protein T484DRAFT_1859149 [Baffinella frigidus]|nr:hypothetical protein T484DRAFT_1859149 [Cryptophyta sp. CCMP2293]